MLCAHSLMPLLAQDPMLKAIDMDELHDVAFGEMEVEVPVGAGVQV